MTGLRFTPIGCLALLAGLTALGGCRKDAPPASGPSRPVVRVARPVVREVTDYAFFTGRTEAVDSVNVQARVTGYLDSIDFQAGADVKKGQQLFRVDPRPYQAALDNAASQVKLMEAKLKLAIADYSRAREIAKTPGAISQQDVDKYAAAENEAYAAVDAAKASAESARLNLEFTSIASPVDGVVGRNLLTLGNLVKQDVTLLTTVVSQDPMYAYFDVDEHTLLRLIRMFEAEKIKTIDKKRTFLVEMGLADEGERYPHRGEIDFINNRIDPTTGTLQVRGTFANPVIDGRSVRLLKPGMFVRIRLPMSDPHKALLAPEAAVGTDQGRKYLLAVDAKDVVEYRPIELGPQQPDGLQVVAPLKMDRTKDGLRPADDKTPSGAIVDSITANDRIIVGGLQRVRPGMQVESRPAEPVPDARKADPAKRQPAP